MRTERAKRVSHNTTPHRRKARPSLIGVGALWVSYGSEIFWYWMTMSCCLDSWWRQNWPRCRVAGVIMSARGILHPLSLLAEATNPPPHAPVHLCRLYIAGIHGFVYCVSGTGLRFSPPAVQWYSVYDIYVRAWFVYVRALRPVLGEVDQPNICSKLQDRRSVCPHLFYLPRLTAPRLPFPPRAMKVSVAAPCCSFCIVGDLRKSPSLHFCSAHRCASESPAAVRSIAIPPCP